MTLALALLAVPIIALFAGLLLAAADSVGPPPTHTRCNPSTPLRGLNLTSGNQRNLEAAPHRGRLIAWGGAIWRSR